MMISSMLRLTEQQKLSIIEHVSSTFDDYKEQLSTYKSRMLKIYENVTTYEERPQAKWQTSFKVNKAFETENKVLPRIIANQPKWLTSLRTDEFDEEDRNLTPEMRAEKVAQVTQYADAIRDYLTTVFNKYDVTNVAKLLAKNTVRYGM
jgi:hypothetical protein